jgi:asparagine synthase (glutamine-hydrolysing)
MGLCGEIRPFPPGHYYAYGRSCATPISRTCRSYRHDDLETVPAGTSASSSPAWTKRLDADAPLGFLLSGGLDSSLVCAIREAAGAEDPHLRHRHGHRRHRPQIRPAGRRFIGADHTEVLMTREEVLDTLPEVIGLLGTWDITTIRASMGMYLCCKAIHEQTDVRVLLTGEISDELFGYKYTDFAPTAEAFQQEAKKRVDELYMYDVLRADRCISANSLEARVPFGDLAFVKYVMSIDPG